ncbi:vacuolar sorting protein 39 domain 2-domain-containing protein, partial [Blyttiomyces helicus]
YDVFHVQSIVESLPLKIDAIANYDNKVLVGTADGSLLLYSIEEEPSFAIDLLYSKKNFAAKAIDQIGVVAKANALVILSDGIVALHDLTTMDLRMQLGRTRGASSFSVWSGSMKTPSNADDEDSDLQMSALGPEAKLCVSVKRKLIIYDAGVDGNMSEMKELTLADRPRLIVWVNATRIVVAYTRSYVSIDVTTGASVELFSHARPSLTAALASFSPTKLYPVAYSPPYVVGLFAQHIEVRSLRTGGVVQTLELPNARIMLIGPTLYVASPTSIWRLLPLDFEDQIEQLIAASLYSEAQRLIEELDFPTEEDKVANIIRVRGLYAHHVFTVERKFEEAVSILDDLKASPLDVINLFPDLVPPDPDSEPAEPPPPLGREALLVLMDYLTKQRTVLSKLKADLQHQIASSDTAEPPPTPDTRLASSWTTDGYLQNAHPEYPNLVDTEYLCEVVDNTLLKVYLAVNHALIGSLVRVANSCNVDECEALLLAAGRYSEIVDLYRGKGLHRKALDFLITRITSPDAPFELARIIAYMHGLNLNQDIDLLLEYSTWVLKRDTYEGITIFTEHYDEMSTATKRRILEHLESISSDHAITFLEHTIHERKDITPDFHDHLIFKYLEQLEQQLATSSNFWARRRTLVAFLESSTVYRAERVLARFPADALFEERAVVLSRLKRHEEALRIYIDKVRNYQLANSYCEKHYDPSDPKSQDVFLILYRLYLKLVASGQITLDIVIAFLTLYGPNIDEREAMALLPRTVPLADLLGYFEKVLHEMHRTRNSDDFVKNILKAEQLQVHERLIMHQSRRIHITDERMCSHCLKRLANYSFTCFPNGAAVHVFC